ncbi:Uncharacterised protein [uncultured Roseburia sp.]|uniref:Phage protein n=1 Tax=Brotonthovivens ammoniilytica TaxID=2981725 RepID=A0ABT2TMC6_9FIRM|nr:hypothetical protein [Brotonthovivens ammoniilytica]MCU6763370.1 hypothetical protein [Brotonthovivens ammoniilytica]SCJ15248.1 Uncharacterised protein [uncultured Roseburia sp.]
MKLTYNEITVKHNILMEIGKLTLPRKVSVAIARNLIRLEKELKLAEEQRADIADRYAAKDENGNFVLDKEKYTFQTVADEKSFLEEAKELNEMEVEVQIMKFQAEELERCEQVERYAILTPLQEAALEWMANYGDQIEK